MDDFYDVEMGFFVMYFVFVEISLNRLQLLNHFFDVLYQNASVNLKLVLVSEISFLKYLAVLETFLEATAQNVGQSAE